MVERFFRDITARSLRRGVFRSVPELIGAIEAYIVSYNSNPTPFVWTAKAAVPAERRVGAFLHFDALDQLVQLLIFIRCFPILRSLELVPHLLRTLVVHRRVSLLEGLCQFKPSFGNRFYFFCSYDFLIVCVSCVRIDSGRQLDDLRPPRPDRLGHEISFVRRRSLQIVRNVFSRLTELCGKLILPGVEGVRCDLAYRGLVPLR